MVLDLALVVLGTLCSSLMGIVGIHMYMALMAFPVSTSRMLFGDSSLTLEANQKPFSVIMIRDFSVALYVASYTRMAFAYGRPHPIASHKMALLNEPGGFCAAWHDACSQRHSFPKAIGIGPFGRHPCG
jgi:hypothetical protein